MVMQGCGPYLQDIQMHRERISVVLVARHNEAVGKQEVPIVMRSIAKLEQRPCRDLTGERICQRI